MTYYSLHSNKSPDKQDHQSAKTETKPQTQTYQEAQLVDFDSIAPVKQPVDHEFESTDSEKVSMNLPPRAMAELLNRTNDFKASVCSGGLRPPGVAYWYGLSHFVVISPTRSSKFINSESKGNLALSSAAIAINNTGWLVLCSLEKKIFLLVGVFV